MYVRCEYIIPVRELNQMGRLVAAAVLAERVVLAVLDTNLQLASLVLLQVAVNH